MNKTLRQRVMDLFHQYDTVMLVTCGQAGPQISQVAYRPEAIDLHLFVPHNSDHLFNLESQSDVVLVSPAWKLMGKATLEPKTSHPALENWQRVVKVTPYRLHVLAKDGQNPIETIDF
ncbi:hypothetical protein G4Y79_16875 [Phototrophicus methaneseepsis]|uniref:Pyridoxamine 5'-phosphate oxidase putative domain-containing protein n=1 Tax=Phototrophicus methaneseepsis TaxID=2710758 RepID=A0A7S8IDA8_9CHLR|nr:hypothetical protein [Phototrophicus methaneseepsis]QPC81361.1 hypothetical protein G4Y79_16875 [Phototrophicus methaneseepsis]